MKKYKYNYKRKTLSIALCEIEGKIFYDVLFFVNNSDIDTFQIYNRLRFARKLIIGFPICYGFTNTTCEDAVRSRMETLLRKNPKFSIIDIERITGHSRSSIVRHYMSLKREINGY